MAAAAQRAQPVNGVTFIMNDQHLLHFIPSKITKPPGSDVSFQYGQRSMPIKVCARKVVMTHRDASAYS
jgi:hypothetical protein